MPSPLWGPHDIPVGSQLVLQLGSLDLWVQRHRAEWRVAYRQADDPLREGQSVAVSDLGELPDDLVAHRFATDRSDARLFLQPRTADRPVVVRPSAPLHLAAADTATIFTSTPVWVALAVAGHELTEVPTHRPNDTWFGATTREGQLCYAGRTTARLRAEALLRRPGRLYTQVKVTNHGVDPLQIERVQLPVPHMSVGLASDGTLWTPPLTLVRTGEEPAADVQIGRKGADLQPVGDGPRLGGKPSIMVRALGALLS
jgi:hypothetical protein